MTKIVLSLIFAMIFVIASFSKPLIPCDKESWELCKLEGKQNYFMTNKLSDPYLGGSVSFVIIFLLSYVILETIFHRRRIPNY